jgi:hypothetical protein
MDRTFGAIGVDSACVHAAPCTPLSPGLIWDAGAFGGSGGRCAGRRWPCARAHTLVEARTAYARRSSVRLHLAKPQQGLPTSTWTDESSPSVMPRPHVCMYTDTPTQVSLTSQAGRRLKTNIPLSRAASSAVEPRRTLHQPVGRCCTLLFPSPHPGQYGGSGCSSLTPEDVWPSGLARATRLVLGVGMQGFGQTSAALRTVALR